MMRPALVFCLLLLSGPTQAQEGPIQPILEMELSADEVVPGSPVRLSISVMVPTWMPEPPAFPDLEVPHLMVRQPPDSVRSTRRRVNRQMWVGVKREYLLYPMIPGEFVIPPRPLLVTYADADTRAPINVTVQTDSLRLFGIVPPEARGLEPFIAANSLELTQTLEGLDQEMIVGDAFKRQVTATIDGTSPLFLPPLLPGWSGPGVSAYPAEPVIEDTSSGEEKIGGTRTESVSYAIEQGGQFELPAVGVRWFKLSTRTIETANLEPAVFKARLTLAQHLQSHWRTVAAALLTVLLLPWLGLRLFPALMARLRQKLALVSARYRGSAAYSARQALKAIKHRDLDATFKHVQAWLERLPPGAAPDTRELRESLAGVGGARYAASGQQLHEAWQPVREAMRIALKNSKQRRKHDHKTQILPPLNPRVG